MPNDTDKTEWLRVGTIITAMKAAEEFQDVLVGQQNNRVN